MQQQHVIPPAATRGVPPRSYETGAEPRVIDPNRPVDHQVKILNELIARPPQGSRVITITPGLAAYVLEHTALLNRVRSADKVKLYAEAMSNDCWELNGQSIIFSKAGKLADGQHRMVACIKAECPFTTHVVFGIPDQNFNKIDRGKARTASHIFAMRGYCPSGLLSSATKWFYLLSMNSVNNRDTIEPDELLRIYETYLRDKGFGECLETVRQNLAGIERLPDAVITAMTFIFRLIDKKATTAFLNDARVRRGKAGVLLKWLDELFLSNAGRIHEVCRAHMIILTWQAYVAKTPLAMQRLKVTPSDDFPLYPFDIKGKDNV